MPSGLSAPSAIYQFDDSASELNDRIGSNTLTLGAGTEQHASIDGLVGYYLDSSTRLSNGDNALNATGAITVELTLSAVAVPSGIGLIILHEPTSTSENAADNATYYFYQGNQLLTIYLNQEGGSGTNDTNNATVAVLPVGGIHHLVYTRASDGVTRKIYLDGVLLASSVATVAPTSGTNGRFHIGYASTGFRGIVFSVRVALAVEYTAAQVLESYNRVYRV